MSPRLIMRKAGWVKRLPGDDVDQLAGEEVVLVEVPGTSHYGIGGRGRPGLYPTRVGSGHTGFSESTDPRVQLRLVSARVGFEVR